MSAIVGVLALQGDFEAHRRMLELSGATVVAVREPLALARCQGLVIPGGESTTMSRLCDRYELWQPLSARIEAGMGVFGTCAGLIMLARQVRGASSNFAQRTLGVLDVDVTRNAYGAQLESFEADVAVPVVGGEPVRGVFIRAPRIDRVGPGVTVLASHNGAPVVVTYGPLLATSFHPEVTGEHRLHSWWLKTLKDAV